MFLSIPICYSQNQKFSLTINFSNPNWEDNLKDYSFRWFDGKSRTKIIDENNKSALEVFYPGDTYGPKNNGAQWIVQFNQKHENIKVKYKIKFPSGFEFVKGGKLPGLIGGRDEKNSPISGGIRSTGYNGWSARIMWRKDGRIAQYVYHPDMKGAYGDDFEWKDEKGNSIIIPLDKWIELTTEIKMNTINKKDGRIQSWLDGKKVLDIKNIQFRKTKEIAIDSFYFSTFFGGNDDTWSPSKDQHILFGPIEITEL